MVGRTGVSTIMPPARRLSDAFTSSELSHGRERSRGGTDVDFELISFE
jgi:hypothetical protein